MKNVALQSLTPLGEIANAYSSVQLTQHVKLRRRRMHEVTGASADIFATMAASKCEPDVIWIGLGRDITPLCPNGLHPYLNPERVIIVEAVSRAEILWAADVALRAEGGFTVIADMPDALTLKESRRLQLAAEQGGGIGLIILRGPANTSAAQTRWRCDPVASDEPAWDWECLKGKSGEAGLWNIREAEVRYGEDHGDLSASATA